MIIDQPSQQFRQLSAKESQLGTPDNMSVISNYDKKFVQYLVGMHNALRKDKIQIDEVASLYEMLSHMKEEQEEDYLNTLLHPEAYKYSKIPSTIPVPSSSFHFHESLIISPNASGNFSFLFNPFYLANAGTTTSFWLNNNAGLTGSASSSFFLATNVGQTIPAVYNEYRVVSASVIVKYIGRLDIVQGVIGGAIVFDQNVNTGDYSVPTNNASLGKYGDFNLAMDAYYTQENLTLNGIRELYFPLDTTFEQYQPLNTSKNGFGMLVYCFGGVPTTASYKIDISVNYEALADATFLNYIPVCSCTSGTEKKADAVQIIQQQPITPEAEGKVRKTPSSGSFWSNLKDSVGSILPSVATLAGTFFPQMKAFAPLIGMAGASLLSNQPTNQNSLNNTINTASGIFGPGESYKSY